MVSGGFHTKGFEAECLKKNLSYAVIAPRIDSLEGAGNYSEAMQGRLSYKPYFETTFYDAFVKDSSAKLLNELRASEQGPYLKLWRDEIIRKLSEKKRITDSGDYTRYVDFLAKARAQNPDGFEEELKKLHVSEGEEVWRRFQAQLSEFAKGLQDLVDRKELTVPNVSTLLARAGQTKPAAVVQIGANQTLVLHVPTPVRAEVREFLRTGTLPKFEPSVKWDVTSVERIAGSVERLEKPSVKNFRAELRTIGMDSEEIMRAFQNEDAAAFEKIGTELNQITAPKGERPALDLGALSQKYNQLITSGDFSFKHLFLLRDSGYIFLQTFRRHLSQIVEAQFGGLIDHEDWSAFQDKLETHFISDGNGGFLLASLYSLLLRKNIKEIAIKRLLGPFWPRLPQDTPFDASMRHIYEQLGPAMTEDAAEITGGPEKDELYFTVYNYFYQLRAFVKDLRIVFLAFSYSFAKNADALILRRVREIASVRASDELLSDSTNFWKIDTVIFLALGHVLADRSLQDPEGALKSWSIEIENQHEDKNLSLLSYYFLIRAVIVLAVKSHYIGLLEELSTKSDDIRYLILEEISIELLSPEMFPPEESLFAAIKNIDFFDQNQGSAFAPVLEKIKGYYTADTPGFGWPTVTVIDRLIGELPRSELRDSKNIQKKKGAVSEKTRILERDVLSVLDDVAKKQGQPIGVKTIAYTLRGESDRYQKLYTTSQLVESVRVAIREPPLKGHPKLWTKAKEVEKRREIARKRHPALADFIQERIGAYKQSIQETPMPDDLRALANRMISDLEKSDQDQWLNTAEELANTLEAHVNRASYLTWERDIKFVDFLRNLFGEITVFGDLKHGERIRLIQNRFDGVLAAVYSFVPREINAMKRIPSIAPSPPQAETRSELRVKATKKVKKGTAPLTDEQKFDQALQNLQQAGKTYPKIKEQVTALLKFNQTLTISGAVEIFIELTKQFGNGKYAQDDPAALYHDPSKWRDDLYGNTVSYLIGAAELLSVPKLTKNAGGAAQIIQNFESQIKSSLALHFIQMNIKTGGQAAEDAIETVFVRLKKGQSQFQPPSLEDQVRQAISNARGTFLSKRELITQFSDSVKGPIFPATKVSSFVSSLLESGWGPGDDLLIYQALVSDDDPYFALITAAEEAVLERIRKAIEKNRKNALDIALFPEELDTSLKADFLWLMLKKLHWKRSDEVLHQALKAAEGRLRGLRLNPADSSTAPSLDSGVSRAELRSTPVGLQKSENHIKLSKILMGAETGLMARNDLKNLPEILSVFVSELTFEKTTGLKISSPARNQAAAVLIDDVGDEIKEQPSFSMPADYYESLRKVMKGRLKEASSGIRPRYLKLKGLFLRIGKDGTLFVTQFQPVYSALQENRERAADKMLSEVGAIIQMSQEFLERYFTNYPEDIQLFRIKKDSETPRAGLPPASVKPGTIASPANERRRAELRLAPQPGTAPSLDSGVSRAELRTQSGGALIQKLEELVNQDPDLRFLNRDIVSGSIRLTDSHKKQELVFDIVTQPGQREDQHTLLIKMDHFWIAERVIQNLKSLESIFMDEEEEISELKKWMFWIRIPRLVHMLNQSAAEHAKALRELDAIVTNIGELDLEFIEQQLGPSEQKGSNWQEISLNKYLDRSVYEIGLIANELLTHRIKNAPMEPAAVRILKKVLRLTKRIQAIVLSNTWDKSDSRDSARLGQIQTDNTKINREIRAALGRSELRNSELSSLTDEDLLNSMIRWALFKGFQYIHQLRVLDIAKELGVDHQALMARVGKNFEILFKTHSEYTQTLGKEAHLSANIRVAADRYYRKRSELRGRSSREQIARRLPDELMGTYESQLDDKFRFAIPAEIAGHFSGKNMVVQLVEEQIDGERKVFARVMSEEDWKNITGDVKEPQAIRTTHGLTYPFTLDGQNRGAIKVHLNKEWTARLGAEQLFKAGDKVKIIGVKSAFEIWRAEDAPLNGNRSELRKQNTIENLLIELAQAEPEEIVDQVNKEGIAKATFYLVEEAERHFLELFGEKPAFAAQALPTLLSAKEKSLLKTAGTRFISPEIPLTPTLSPKGRGQGEGAKRSYGTLSRPPKDGSPPDGEAGVIFVADNDKAQDNLVFDANLLPANGEPEFSKTEDFFRKKIAQGARVLLIYTAQNQAAGELALALSRAVPGIQPVRVGESVQSMTESKLSRLGISGPALFVVSNQITSEHIQLKGRQDEGLVIDRGLSDSVGFNPETLVHAAQLILDARLLNGKQISQGFPFHEITPEIINRLSNLLRQISLRRQSEEERLRAA